MQVQPASMAALLRSARGSGSLNLSNRELGLVPPEVLRITSADLLEKDEKFWEVHELQRLDLSHNAIEELPDGLDPEGLPALHTLRVAHNRLSRLPPGLFRLATLSSLRLENNALREIPPEVGLLSCLADLDVSGNQLRALPEECCLPSLVALRFRGNRVEQLPPSLGRCAQLQVLDGADNALGALPPALSALHKLTTMDLSGNLLRAVVPLGGMALLQVLHLQRNRLRGVPELPPRLGQLFLGSNDISGRPDLAPLLCCRDSLSALDLSENRIEALDGAALGRMGALRSLDLRNNDLAEMPPALGYLPRLGKLLLDGNALRTMRQQLLRSGISVLKRHLRTRGPPPAGVPPERLLPPEEDAFAGAGGAEEGGEARISAAEVAQQVRSAQPRGTLLWRGRGLRAFPLSFSEAARVREALEGGEGLPDLDGGRALSAAAPLRAADLGENGLAQFPAELCAFVESLRDLKLDGNRISAVPAEALGLRLERLDLGRNRLSAAFLPPVAAAAPLAGTLRHLHISGNALEALPDGIFALRHLETLDASMNRIGALPGGGSFALLGGLRSLDLGNNRLRDIAGLARDPPRLLQVLRVENNELRSIPPELGLLESLRAFSFSGNPQRTLRASHADQGVDGVKALLRQRLPQDFQLPPRREPSEPEARQSEEGRRCEGGRRPRALEGPGEGTGGEGGGQGPRLQQEPGERQPQQQPASQAAAGQSAEEVARALRALDLEIEALEDREGSPSLSEAKRCALKKELQRKRSQRIRLRRGA